MSSPDKTVMASPSIGDVKSGDVKAGDAPPGGGDDDKSTRAEIVESSTDKTVTASSSNGIGDDDKLTSKVVDDPLGDGDDCSKLVVEIPLENVSRKSIALASSSPSSFATPTKSSTALSTTTASASTPLAPLSKWFSAMTKHVAKNVGASMEKLSTLVSEKKQRVLEERRVSAEAKTLTPERSMQNDDLLQRWAAMLGEKGGVDDMTARERMSWLSSRRLRALVFHGIPPKVRPRAWLVMLGNEIQMTPALHEITLAKTRSMRRRVHATVLRDIARSAAAAKAVAKAAAAETAVVAAAAANNEAADNDGGDVAADTAGGDKGNSDGKDAGGADVDAATDDAAGTKVDAEDVVDDDNDNGDDDGDDDDDDEGAAVDGNKEASLMLIAADIPRTFPELRVFHGPHGPLYEDMLDLLLAYVALRPDVGYVQGMSYLAAIFLLNLDPYDAFVSFANLLNRPFYFTFFNFDVRLMEAHLAVYDRVFAAQLPQLHTHFRNEDVEPNMYVYDWLLTIFSRALPLDIAVRIMDNYLLNGSVFLFRAALGILSMYASELMLLPFDVILKRLNRPPPNMRQTTLFAHIARITVTEAQVDDLLKEEIQKARAHE
jgi:hypothetical protein